MGYYGPESVLVDRLIERAGRMTLEEAADLYRARAARILVQGTGNEDRALAQARRAAAVSGLDREYVKARHEAATSWRHGLPETQGPWLFVGEAIANAAGALVVSGILDDKAFQLLVGPWRQAIGSMTPVGPGMPSRERVTHR